MSATNERAATGGYDGDYEVVVVGGGAAGLSAALVLGRARRRVAVVDAGAPRNAPAARMHGFLSRDGMPPAALLATGRAEAAAYGVALFDGLVDEITARDGGSGTSGDGARGEGSGGTWGEGSGGFVVRLAGGAALTARRVLVATGLRDELPALPGVRERWGRDVLHCPYCHGYEVRDAPLGVLGTRPMAVHQALMVRQWSPDVVLFAHDLVLTADERERLTARGIQIEEGAVRRLAVADDRLTGVELADGRVVERTAVFVPPLMVPADGPLAGLGCARDEATGAVATDPAGRTSVPGVWAVGNVTDARAQVVVAAGAASVAAMDINHDLITADTDRAVAALRTASATTGA
ncbi:NAD(P)/FAD-dependent oxidoreductase [Streptomyces sp. NPDC058953]|uniref:NAD(P)/FAD-dependent oxidoreductase n=1 Tax=unclassified Streptomyces TaxID=2593676 RepID=UPI0036916EDC